MRDPDSLFAIARAAIAGDTAALDELLAALEPMVVRTARLIVGAGSTVAEDAAQEALLDIARGVSGLRHPEAVNGWALKITTQRAIKIARRERLVALGRAARVEDDVSAEAEDGRAAALKDAFDRLPPRLRATAVLRLYVGLSEAETADVLGCSIGAVKSNLHDARKRLTQTLRRRGFAPTTTQKEAVS